MFGTPEFIAVRPCSHHYYGLKPASDNRNPRLELFLRSDTRGAWTFDTIKPGSYPASRVPAHIHFEVLAPGHAPKIFEIVFEGDPFVTPEMRRQPGFSVRPIEAGAVTDRIILTPIGVTKLDVAAEYQMTIGLHSRLCAGDQPDATSSPEHQRGAMGRTKADGCTES